MKLAYKIIFAAVAQFGELVQIDVFCKIFAQISDRPRNVVFVFRFAAVAQQVGEQSIELSGSLKFILRSVDDLGAYGVCGIGKKRCVIPVQDTAVFLIKRLKKLRGIPAENIHKISNIGLCSGIFESMRYRLIKK